MSKHTPARLAALLAASFMLAAADAGADTNAREVEEDQSLASTLVTPHKAWGRDLVGGPIRALCLIHGGGYGGKWFAPGTRLREAVELKQRFDLDADAVLVGGSGKGNEFLGLDLGKSRAERLLSKPYGVFVFGNLAFEKLPAKFRYLIMKQVVEGAGLVFCGPGSSQFLTAKRQVKPLPAALIEGLPALDGKAAAEVMAAYRLRKGRAVQLRYGAWSLTPSKPFSWRGLAEYDYRMLWVGRAVQWAARREGRVGVATRVAGQEGPNAAPAIELTLTNRGAKRLDCSVAVELRRASDGWTKPLGSHAAALSPGEPVRLPVGLPRLRADDYFVDAIVQGARGVEGCGAVAFQVTSPFGIGEVTLDRAFAERGERITGKATLRGKLPANAALRLRFRDSYNRVLAQREVKLAPSQPQVAFDHTPGPFDTIQMRVEAVLTAGGQEVELKSAEFTVPKRRRGQFNFLQWDTPRDVLGYYAWQQLKQAGMTTCLLGSFGESKPIPVLRAADISMVPYSTRILDPKDEKGAMKPCCWNDGPNAAAHVQKIVDNQKAHREHGVWVYSLGDEGVTLGCCVHPACIAAYRRYLADQYGTVAKLNASWGATYKSFDQADLLDRTDNMERGALAAGKWARWFDRQAFARVNLMRLSGRFVETYKKLDPKAVTGFEGTGRFGDDYDAIIGTNTFYSPYPSIGDDLVRSAAPRELIRANWMGYSKAIDPLADAAWRMVIKGMDSVWFWMWTGVGSWRGYLTPTLDLSPVTQELAEEMRPVRRGLGDLLLQSQMTHSGIAVFYSVPSALSGKIENGREFVDPHTSHEAWARMTYDLGLDFRYVTSAMLKGGVLTCGTGILPVGPITGWKPVPPFKVLLLPMSQAIAPDEAEAIRRFVGEGGTVIADVRPGIYDGHCKPITPGALDDLFGIKRTGRGSPTKGPLPLRASLDGQAVDVQLAESRVDTGVQPAKAKALAHADKTPLLLVNTVGKGRAILLNFQVVLAKEGGEQTVAARQVARALYAAAGAKAAIAATAPDGGALPFTETRVWQNGDALVFGLWRQMRCKWFGPKEGLVAGEPVPAKIVLPSPRHVYDLRAGKYLGRVTEVNALLRWGRASFFHALPYRIDGVVVDLSSRTPSRGQVVTAAVRLDAAAPIGGRHAVFVEVTDPTGQDAAWARQVVVLEKGKGQYQLPVAFNDAPGTWRLRATELFSGKSADATWTLR